MKAQSLISRYREKFKNNIFFQNIAIVVGGNVTAKLIGILAVPIITRLYTPEDYGIFSVFLSAIGIAGSLATMRYAVTIPIAKEEKMAYNMLKLCFLITFSLSLLWLAGISLFGNFLAEKFSAEQLKPFLWFLPIVFFTKGIYEALYNWAIRNKDFRLVTRTNISKSVTSSAIKIGLGALKVTPLGLFIGHIAQEAAGIGSLLLKLKKVRPAFLNKFSWLELKFAAKRYKNFPLIQSWSQLLLAFGAQLPILLIGLFYGAKVVGVFGLAMGMVNMPMDLIGQSIAQVYYAEISKYGKNNPEKIYKLSISIIKKLFWVGLFPVAILILFGPWLFEIIFGSDWSNAGLYARYFSMVVLTRFISSPIINIFNVLEKQGMQLFLNLLRVITVVLIFYVSHIFKLSATETIILYSLIFPLYSLLSIFVVLKTLNGRIKQMQAI